MPKTELPLYVTVPHPCSYLPDQVARTQVALPGERIGVALYGSLLRAGFRRSGMITYRPICDHCRACVSVRIPVDEFQPSRVQKRTLVKHETLTHALMELRFREEHFSLYRRYQSARHSGGEMDQAGRSEYSTFLLESGVSTQLVEFRDNGRLVMVSVIDAVNDGLSSVYTFYDPDVPGASFGTYSILWQIEQCQRASLPFLYLGYWIKESRKMSYKARFRPIDGFVDGAWRRLQPDELDD